MPGTKRKVDEDTWLVTQSKKFKTGVSLNSVFETTLAYLRLGASNFFNSLIGIGSEEGDGGAQQAIRPSTSAPTNLRTSSVSSNSNEDNASASTASVSEGLLSLSPSSPARSSSSASSSGAATPPRHISPPGSPLSLVRDVISDNELQDVSPGSPSSRSVGLMQSAKPNMICSDCVRQSGGKPFGNEDSYGKCSYCDKLVCHMSTCRKCRSEFCGACCIAMYDSSADAYECYNCL